MTILYAWKLYAPYKRKFHQNPFMLQKRQNKHEVQDILSGTTV